MEDESEEFLAVFNHDIDYIEGKFVFMIFIVIVNHKY